jgi:hypothetical protein
VPSLGLLFTLYLRGRLDTAEKSAPQARTRARPAAGLGSEPASRGMRVRVRGGAAVAGVVVGTGLLVFADAGWAHLVGVACLVVCAVAVFLLAAPGEAELRSGSSPLSHIINSRTSCLTAEKILEIKRAMDTQIFRQEKGFQDLCEMAYAERPRVAGRCPAGRKGAARLPQRGRNGAGGYGDR